MKRRAARVERKREWEKRERKKESCSERMYIQLHMECWLHLFRELRKLFSLKLFVVTLPATKILFLRIPTRCSRPPLDEVEKRKTRKYRPGGWTPILSATICRTRTPDIYMLLYKDLMTAPLSLVLPRIKKKRKALRCKLRTRRNSAARPRLFLLDDVIKFSCTAP